MVSAAEENLVICIVDPDEQSRGEVTALLQRVGYSTRGYHAAEDLIAGLVQLQLCSCVISEMDLPGMSGIELMESLRGRGVNCPVIILTWHADVRVAVQAIRSSVADYLVKPLVERQLVNRVRAVLGVQAHH